MGIRCASASRWVYITSVNQPSPVKVTIQVHEDLVPLIQAQCPKSLSTTTFCALLLEQGLTGGCTLTERAPASAGEGGGSVVSTSSITTTKRNTLTNKSIYPNLQPHEELIRGFWRVKKGSKSDQGWKLLNTELTKIQELYGDTVVQEQLELAINGLWKGVSLRLYEQYLPKGQAKAPARPKRSEEEMNAQSKADFDKFWEEMNNG